MPKGKALGGGEGEGGRGEGGNGGGGGLAGRILSSTQYQLVSFYNSCVFMW